MYKRVVAILLCFLLLMSVMPASAAEDFTMRHIEFSATSNGTVLNGVHTLQLLFNPDASLQEKLDVSNVGVGVTDVYDDRLTVSLVLKVAQNPTDSKIAEFKRTYNQITLNNVPASPDTKMLGDGRFALRIAPPDMEVYSPEIKEWSKTHPNWSAELAHYAESSNFDLAVDVTAHYDRDGITPTAAEACTNCGVEIIVSTSDSGFSLSNAAKWTASTWPDSTGATHSGASYYGNSAGEYVQYKPSDMQAGWYNVYFWNMKCYEQQNPVKMTATVYSNGKTVQNIPLAVTTATVDREGAWTLVGTYYFTGSGDEYLRLVSNGGSNARPADAKFELNREYTPPLVTSARIGTQDGGFSMSGYWTPSTMADSTGSTVSGASYYGNIAGDYVQYKPEYLKPGWYDVSFWNIKYAEHQDPIKMSGTVYSNGKLEENIPLEVSTATVDRTGAWTKVGTYYFAGTNDEYFRLVCTGGSNARPADAKFELNENYSPALPTSAHITTSDKGFYASGYWTPSTMADSTGNTTNGASYYGNVAGDYVQYSPGALEPGWYDISFWNLKYASHQDPMKMNGTVYSNGKLEENIPLEVSTATVDRTGAWTKVGTYYFDGTGDEYFRLVCTGGTNARPADVKFEKNNEYVPFPTLGSEAVTISYEDEKWEVIGADGIFELTINRTVTGLDGLFTLYRNDAIIDQQYSDFTETGIEEFGVYQFSADDKIKLVYTSHNTDTRIPVDTITFAPADAENVQYSLMNLQRESEEYFIEAGMHQVETIVTNDSGANQEYQLVIALYEGDLLVKTAIGEKKTVENGESESIKATVAINAITNNTYLKAYVWESVISMKPKFDAKVYRPKSNTQPSAFSIEPASCTELGTWTQLSATDGCLDGTVFSGTTHSNASLTSPAVATFDAMPGTYRVWVRSKNFTDRPDMRHFSIEINGEKVGSTFGQVGIDGYQWEDGGTVELDGYTTFKLLDSSASYAKVDVVMFTLDLDAAPPQDVAELEKIAPAVKPLTTEMTDSAMMLNDFSLDKDFPGGNYKLTYIGDNTVAIGPDMKGPQNGTWFYWNFKATSDVAQTVNFELSGCDVVIGNSGVVYSKDDGKTWDYLSESAKGKSFSYTFEEGETVWFSCVMPYQVSRLNAFLETIEDLEDVSVTTLCESEEGREVPLIRIGSETAPKAVLFTARHHASETTASYMLEGIMDYLASNTSAEVFNDYCFYIVPMVDIDGVENGDQGKNRYPHDHNRDYSAGKYAPVRAIKTLAESIDVEFAMDIHCPYLWDYGPYFSYFPENEEEVLTLHNMLIEASDVNTDNSKIVYEDGWNRPDATQEATQMKGWFYRVENAPFAATFEFPFSGDVGDEYTEERMLNFGRFTATVIESYLLGVTE